MIPLASTDESMVLYYKMKSDYYRYLAECATGDAKGKAAEGARVAHAEATKTSSRDRISQYTVEQSLDVPVPEMAKQLVEVPETVSQDRIQQRTVEQIVDAPVPQAVEELAEVFRVFSQDGIQQRAVEQTTPATSLVEMIVEVPVARTPEKAQQVANTLVQHAVNTVEVERPKIIKQTVQRKKPLIQEKINQVTKHVEVPEVPPLQFTDKVIDKPVVAQRQIPMVQAVQKTMEVPQLQCVDEAIDGTVVQAPRVQVVEKTVEGPQLQIVEQIIETPETQTIQSTQTSERLGGAPVRRGLGEARRPRCPNQVPRGRSTSRSTRKPFGQRIGKQGLCDGRDVEERRCDGRDMEEETSIPSRSEQGGF